MVVLPNWPKNLEEAVRVCLLTLTAKEKQVLKNASKDNLIMLHISLRKNIREKFGLWEGNEEFIKFCHAANPDDASMRILRAVWRELNR